MIGVEPTLPFGNQNLNLARLPISPHPHGKKEMVGMTSLSLYRTH